MSVEDIITSCLQYSSERQATWRHYRCRIIISSVLLTRVISNRLVPTGSHYTRFIFRIARCCLSQSAWLDMTGVVGVSSLGWWFPSHFKTYLLLLFVEWYNIYLSRKLGNSLLCAVLWRHLVPTSWDTGSGCYAGLCCRFIPHAQYRYEGKSISIRTQFL